ncbi:MAG: hypothetical protein EOQ38_32805, partial [Mesorhizobium sp.]
MQYTETLQIANAGDHRAGRTRCGQRHRGGLKAAGIIRKSRFTSAFCINWPHQRLSDRPFGEDFVRAPKKSHAVSIRGVAYKGHLPYRKSVTFQILGGTEMRYKFLTAAFAATAALNFAGPA